MDAARASRSIDRALSRYLEEAKKKARKTGPEVVAPTGIEPATRDANNCDLSEKMR
jgi:hypothetical protein